MVGIQMIRQVAQSLEQGRRLVWDPEARGKRTIPNQAGDRLWPRSGSHSEQDMRSGGQTGASGKSGSGSLRSSGSGGSSSGGSGGGGGR